MLIFCAIRPLLGPAGCYFDPSCGVFALNQLAHEPLHKALPAIARQVLACHPFRLKWR